MNPPSPVRTVGIVGAGRTRIGLGPYLARDCERAGLRVAAIAGRDAVRTQAVAAEFAQRFGHPVDALTDVHELARRVDAVVVATPVDVHHEALAAALAARRACLCEKPLVAPAQWARGRELVDGFAAAGLLLHENCQWPFVLPVFDALHPGARRAPPRAVAMGLSPAEPGPWMVLDSLSHVLSVAQAALPVGASIALSTAVLDDPSVAAEANALRAQLAWRTAAARGELAVELHLRVCPKQPRPAWLSIDGARIDRRIGADYAIAFAGGGRELAADDPLPLCVAAFARDLQHGDAATRAAATATVRTRLDLYHGIVQAIGLGAAP